MQQVHSKENCLLYLGEDIDPDTVDPHTIYAPGNTCLNCSIKTGKPGVDGYGVIQLRQGLDFNEDKREVVNTEGSIKSGATACVYQCRIPKNVEVKPELDTPPEVHP